MAETTAAAPPSSAAPSASPFARPTPVFQDLLYSKKDGVATVTLNRPDTYNCYTTRTLQELIAAFQDASWDDAVHVIVYTGAGTRAFCTGGDVREYSTIYTQKPRDYWKYMALFRGYLEAILHSGKPVIARLNGMAVGGGNESQLACDLTVIAEHAYVGQVGTSVGSVACGGATQWLPLVVGDKRAREMLLLNPKIPARRALEWGLVNAVAPSVTRGGAFIENPTPEDCDKAQKKLDGYAIDLSRLDAQVADWAAQIKNKFPECTRYTKVQTNTLKDLVWNLTVGHAQDWLSTHFGGLEPWEGMRAFVEKRKTDFGKVRRTEFLWGPPARQCSCGAVGLPGDFKFCGVCGKAL